MVAPLTPDEVSDSLLRSIPDGVIEAVNELLTKKLRGTNATLYQDDIKNRAIEIMGIEWKEFDNGWLDFEPLFRDAGWEVQYYKPPYYSDERPTFMFSRGKRN